MATSYLEDRTKYRANQWSPTWSGNQPDIETTIGREDYKKVKLTAEYATEYGGTVSGTEGTILI